MDVDNFFFGIQAALGSVVETLRVVSRYQLFLGFIVGFAVASVIHAILSSEHIRHVPAMVLSDPSKSFQTVYPAGHNGSFDHSFTNYAKNVQNLKTIFYVAALLIIILLMLVTFAFK